MTASAEWLVFILIIAGGVIGASASALAGPRTVARVAAVVGILIGGAIAWLAATNLLNLL